MARERKQHVVPTKDGWAVKPAGSPKAMRGVRDATGTTYGRDPYSPPG